MSATPPTDAAMNGAESLVHTLLASGVDTCFANPGTSEMHFVAALDRVPGMRCVLGLFEGVVTGAADGYARIAGKPAATLLHCGPGLGNGLANLHNGRRANTMMVNCVGDQATYHRPLDAPLTADTEGLARSVSGWVRTASKAANVGADAAVAVQAAQTSPGQIATLILPSDTCWDAGGVVGQPLPVPKAPTVDGHVVRNAAAALRNGRKTLILLGNGALRTGPLADAARIAAAHGAMLLAQGSNGRIERGAGRHPIGRIPYPVDQAVELLKDIEQIILIGAIKPVIFFAYPNKPGTPVPPNAVVHILTRPEHDQAQALAALAEELGQPKAVPVPGYAGGELGRGKITSEAFAASLVVLMPENAIVSDESVTFGRSIWPITMKARAHDWLAVTGGAIGGGIPLATGCAVAAPDRRVVNLQADGSAMYTIQGLWTQAREKLDVTTVIFSNRKYQILLGELANVGANPGRTALDMMDLGNPDMDFVKMANGMGVDAARADTMEQFNDLFAQSLNRKGPYLIELMT
jgi:acetolactate synthase-1/2/3 large subunit